MPIYEYLCNSCGLEKEHLQKMSDAPITTCPACGSNAYTKLVSAAGFQLKGTGWYVTDFRDKKAKKSEASESKEKTKASSMDKTAAKPAAQSTNTSTNSASTVD